MAFLVAFHWGWLLASILLGLAMGWIAVVHRGPEVSKRTSRWLAVLTLALLISALSRVIPGRPGYWLDLALLMFAIYLLGCAVGSWLRDWVISRSARAS
jgi:hypothetical protein